MIRIDKRSEPEAWRSRRLTPDSSAFESIPELRVALLEEQGYICAYCMRRIPVRDPSVDADSKIEHIRPRSTHPHLQTDYRNLAICCPGNMDDDPHCDHSKGDAPLGFELYDSRLQESVSYSLGDGTIRSSMPEWDDELNGVLNLNHARLKANRRQALDAVLTTLKRLNSRGDGWSHRSIRGQLVNWASRDRDGRSIPFCGIVIWFLEKKLKV